jgi:hypothetical protein
MKPFEWILAVVCSMGILLILLTLPKWECENKASKMGFNYTFQWLGGCMIEVKPNQWIPIDNYRWMGKNENL